MNSNAKMSSPSGISISKNENTPNATVESSSGKSDNVSTIRRSLRKRVAQRKPLGGESNSNRSSRGKSSHLSWNLEEKKSLLEGLKLYGPQSHKLIANLVGSKSEAEVQEKIFSLRGDAGCDTQSADGTNTDVRAPIEKWIHSLCELVHCENNDHSHEISKTLRYIAKYEDFPEKQGLNLSWAKIYFFLSGLAEHRTGDALPVLSDIESTILLELMTDLGTTLNQFNTTSQRRILEHKIQLINAGAGVHCNNRAKKFESAKLIASALGNDFSDVKDLIDSTSGSASTSKSCAETFPESTDSIENGASALTLSGTDCTNWVSKDDFDLNEHVKLRNSEGLDKTFIKPKLFTLDPLCIPTKLLNFQPKDA